MTSARRRLALVLAGLPTWWLGAGCYTQTDWRRDQLSFQRTATEQVRWGKQRTLKVEGTLEGHRITASERPVCREVERGNLQAHESRHEQKIEAWGTGWLLLTLGGLGYGLITVTNLEDDQGEVDEAKLWTGLGATLGATLVFLPAAIGASMMDATQNHEERVVSVPDSDLARFSGAQLAACGEAVPLQAAGASLAFDVRDDAENAQFTLPVGAGGRTDLAGEAAESLAFWAHECDQSLNVTVRLEAPGQAPLPYFDEPLTTLNLSGRSRAEVEAHLAESRAMTEHLKLSENAWLQQRIDKAELELDPAKAFGGRDAAGLSPQDGTFAASKLSLSIRPNEVLANEAFTSGYHNPIVALADRCIAAAEGACVGGDARACDRAQRHAADPAKRSKLEGYATAIRERKCRKGDSAMCEELAARAKSAAQQARYHGMAFDAKEDTREAEEARERAEYEARVRAMEEAAEAERQRRIEAERQRRAEEARRRREAQNSGLNFGQVAALAAGAAALGAMDVPNEVKAEVGAAMATDILTDGKAGATAKVRDDYAKQAAAQKKAASSSRGGGSGAKMQKFEYSFQCAHGRSDSIKIPYFTQRCLDAAKVFTKAMACNEIDAMNKARAACKIQCGHPNCLESP